MADEHVVLAIFHLLFVVPLFLAIGILRTSLPGWSFPVILGLGIVLFLYQGYKLVMRLLAGSSSAWINAIHVILIAPLLIYIGWNAEGTTRPAFELALLAGFAALGYHGYNLILAVH
jgi:hypothetical protein